MFTLAAQLLFVIHTAVGVKVALAPVKEGKRCWGGVRGREVLKEDNDVNMSEYSENEKQTAFILLDNEAEVKHVLDQRWNYNRARRKPSLLKLQEGVVQRRQVIPKTNVASLFPSSSFSLATRGSSSVLIVPLEDV